MTDFRLSLTTRAYRRLLGLLLPERFRARYAHQMVDVFAELDASARRAGGTWRAWRVLGAEILGLLRLAARERYAEGEAARRSRRSRAPSHRHPGSRKAPVLESLLQDLRFAGRALRRSPLFTLVAVFTLALGVGANTAIFSLVNGVLLRPLPVLDPDRLFAVGEQSTSTPGQISVTSPANLYDWQRSATTLRIAGFSSTTGTVTGRGDPVLLSGTMSVGGIFQVLGLQPYLGRALTSEDEDPAAPAVIVLSHATWRDLFGEDRAAVGQSITVNGTPRTIVGIMPPGYSFLGDESAFYAPARFETAFRENRDQYFILAVGRLDPDATIEQARAELATIAARLRRDWPGYNENLVLLAQPLHDIVVGSARVELLVLMGAVAFVLLITCANLGNLLLARAHARRREMAVRQALGAGQGRIARQLLTEGVLLALVGGAAGLLVARLFLGLLMAAEAATNLPRAGEIALDGRVLLFTLGVSVLTGLLFGSAPAWQLARAGRSGGSSDALRDGARGSTGGTVARSALVVSELALAMMLLIGAGLLLRSFDLLLRVDPGVRSEQVLTFSVRLPTENRAFFPQSLERIRALPGVRSAAVTSQLPVSGRGIGAWLNLVDRPFPPGMKPTGEAYRVVSPGYFETMGIALRRGRLLRETDRIDAPVVVINEALARKYYPGEDPIGRPIYMGAPDNRLFEQGTIVGVVSDTRDAGLGTDALPAVYIPLAVMPAWPAMNYVVQTRGDPTGLIAATRAVIRALDPSLPVRNVRTMDDVVNTALAPARWSSALLGTFAGVALVIAVLGVFGVLSFVVTQRTRELGIMIALGATPEQVRRLVLRRGLVLTVSGLVLGALGALGLTRFMGTLLYGVTATDTATYVGVAAVLLGASVLASYLPARRATRVDPILALRAE
ncbi:MAG TPA: ABC transporter permease [Gemmatimonadaceae bacterium]|nr:ABC transporter permease [Gemmatimonadaceae bacterium]